MTYELFNALSSKAHTVNNRNRRYWQHRFRVDDFIYALMEQGIFYERHY